MGYSKSIFKRAVHVNKCLFQETRQISYKKPFLPQGNIKEQMKPKVSRKKAITEIRVKIKDTDTEEKNTNYQ